MALRRLMPLVLLPGLATPGCAGADDASGSAAVALRDSLASTRASLAALGSSPASGPATGSPLGPAGAAAGQVAAASVATTPAPAPASLPIGPWSSAATPRRRGAGTGPPPAEAGQLLGLGAEAVMRWLGEPALRRPEGPAEIWLYTAPACALDLVLYRDAAGGEAGPLRVGFAAARASGAEPRAEAACLGEIAAGAAGRPAESATGAVASGPPRRGGG